MGRGRGRGGRGGGRGKRQWNGGEGGQGAERSVRPRTNNWQPDIVSNGLFEEYYKGQDICPPEEWDAFIAALKRPLPITFRINGQGKFADRLVARLESNFMQQFTDEPVVIDGEAIEKPHPLEWYPGKLAWQMNFSRAQLRKLPVLEELHEFIKRENETGSITRQEAVSMVPPLFLDVEPHHRVLDMCAAPGSKTFQLLEALHGGPAPATGLVVANDADARRCNLLTHQTKRMCSPNVIVTNHEAQAFPLLRNLLPESKDTESHFLFDRILCDVPCSGDGTLRKAPDIWRRWGTANGNGLHSLQLKITLRACELLRVGGRLVYSTCTFNPVEDEAVVAEVLRRTKGAFELVDVSDHLPLLRRLPGKQRWRVKDRDNWYDSWEEGQKGIKLDPTMFPDAESDAMPLHRCMRFLPHHQDTGGFFVCVLQKVRELDAPLEPVTLDHRTTRTKERKAAERQEQAAAKEGAAAEGAAEGAAAAGAGAEAVAVKAEGDGADGAAPMDADAPAEAAAEVKQEQPDVKQEQQEVKQEEGQPAVAVKEEPAEVKEEPAEEKQEPGAEVKTEGGEAAAAGGEEAAGGGKGEAGQKTGYWKRRREAEQEALYGQLPEWGPAIRGGAANRGKEGGGGRHRGVDPVVPYVEEQQLSAMTSFYGLAPDCPVPHALIARSLEGRPKKLHYVSPAVRDLLRVDVREQLKIIGAGVKTWERQDDKDGLVPCCYRIAQDGLPALLPHVTKQRFTPTVDELMALLQHRNVALPIAHQLHMTKPPAAAAPATDVTPEEAAADAAEASEQPQEGAAEGEQAAAQPAAAEGEQQAAPAAAEQQQQQQQQQQGDKKPRAVLSDALTLDQLDAVAMGCCVALLRPEDAAALGFAESDDGDSGLVAAAPFSIACWRGRASINVLVSKQEAAQMIERITEARAKLAAAAGQPAAADVAPAAAEPAAEPVAA